MDCIHPGYGFLSENAKFVKRCEEEGIMFIGPKSETIQVSLHPALAHFSVQPISKTPLHALFTNNCSHLDLYA